MPETHHQSKHLRMAGTSAKKYRSHRRPKASSELVEIMPEVGEMESTYLFTEGNEKKERGTHDCDRKRIVICTDQSLDYVEEMSEFPVGRPIDEH